MRKELTGKQKLMRVGVWIAGFGVSVIAIAGICLAMTDLPSSAAQLNTNLATLKKLGFATTVQEYQERIRVPDNLNAGPKYMALFTNPELHKEAVALANSVKRSSGGKFTFLNPDRESPKMKAWIAELKKLSALPFCVTTRDKPRNPDQAHQDFVAVINLTIALTATAAFEVENGNVQSGLDRLMLSARLANWADDEKRIYRILNRRLIAIRMENQLRSMITRYGKNQEFIAGLEPILKEISEPYPLREAVLNEPIGASELTHMLQKIPDPTPRTFKNIGRQLDQFLYRTAASTPIIAQGWENRILEMYVVGAKTLPKQSSDYSEWGQTMTNMHTFSEGKGESFRQVKAVGAVVNLSLKMLRTEQWIRESVIRAANAALAKFPPESKPRPH